MGQRRRAAPRHHDPPLCPYRRTVHRRSDRAGVFLQSRNEFFLPLLFLPDLYLGAVAAIPLHLLAPAAPTSEDLRCPRADQPPHRDRLPHPAEVTRKGALDGAIKSVALSCRPPPRETVRDDRPRPDHCGAISSVMFEIVSWLRSTPSVATRWCSISRTVSPPASSETTRPAEPPVPDRDQAVRSGAAAVADRVCVS